MSPPRIPGVLSPGDDPGQRTIVTLDSDGVDLEAGSRLQQVAVAYETWGTLNPSRDNAILVLHALTGDSHANGPVGPGHRSPGFWNGLIGPGAPLDTERYFIICPNVLGGCQGTTGPASLSPDGALYGSRFPLITIRDQVRVEALLADQLGIARWAGVIGGSMGGMRALEWCVGYPDRVARGVVIAVGAAATADEIALCSLQVRAIEADPDFFGGDYYGTGSRPLAGLSIARGLGQISYRSAAEFESRFGRAPQAQEDPLKGGRFAVESYLEHHGDKLADRFDPNSYIVLSQAMNSHDLGRGRGGVPAALGAVRAKMTVAGITSDRLYPLDLQREICCHLPGAPSVVVVDSEFGHDGFLLEIEQIGAIIDTALGSE